MSESAESEDFVTVRVSKELVKILSTDWSEPVQLKIYPPIDSEYHEMIARRAVVTALFHRGRIDE